MLLETPLSAAQFSSRALSSSAKLFLLALTAPALRGSAQAVEQLGARVGLAPRTTYRAVGELREMGLVEWRPAGCVGMHNGGTLVFSGADYALEEPHAQPDCA